VDHDRLELSNLQRQIAHTTARIGQNKAESAAEALRALNPEARVEIHAMRMDAAVAKTLIPQYDIICDGTDNFPTRFLLGDACHLLKKPLVSAAVLRFEGQLSVFQSHHEKNPCHRCLHPEPPPDGMIPSCSEAGVLGAVTGVMGCLQATEVLKLILGIGETLTGRLLLWDALDARMRTIKLRRDPGCALCGEAPDDTPKGLPVFKVQTAHFKSLTRKPLTASDEEASKNPRARSAKLRGVEKLS
jgi:adenylyltransferase/sulfurtransferase